MIDDAQVFFDKHFGRDDVFNVDGWRRIVDVHDGKLPVVIKAVPEGSLVDVLTPLMTVENTDPKLPWLTNYLETILCEVWYPITVATQSYYMKQTILKYLSETGTPSDVGFKLHDFGFRGSTSQESASIGGAAHLVNFLGTDTMVALEMLNAYYDCEMAGFSIPATEHSTITSWGKDNEVDAFDNMITQFPDGIVACVSDSFDIYQACNQFWGRDLRDKVMSRDGTLVIRPDCYDDQTEILTSSGWKLFKDLDKRDFVAQVYDDGHYEFVIPVSYIDEYYSGDMIYIHDYFGKVDLLVTPNHRVVYKQRGEMHVQCAKDCTFYHKKDIVRSACATDNDRCLTPIEMLRIAFQADGSYQTTGNRIRFSFLKTRKIERLEAILTLSDIEYKIYDLKDGKREFNIDYDSDLISKDFAWVDTSKLDATWCRQFIEELSYWDATRRHDARFKFDTTNKSVVQIVELIAISAGYGCLVSHRQDCRKEHFNDVYTAHILKNNLAGGQSITVETNQYDGHVYCVTVPTGKILVRRNRGTAVSGNSGYPPEVVINCLRILGNRFGVIVNDKGYKVLDSHVRMIQGDGIDHEMIILILRTMKTLGWSADNIAFGSGGALLQKMNRDTYNFAFKCSEITIDGKQYPVFKDPVTQSNKVSKSGRFDGLTEVFRDGEVLVTYTLDEIRERLDQEG
jgi:nicotinic acid phosphoribosyltransferase